MKCDKPLNIGKLQSRYACDREMEKIGKIDHQVKAAYVLYQCPECKTIKLI